MLVLLDRDGVINKDHKPHGTLDLTMLEIYPEALQALALLKKHHIHVAVVTNQSAIGKKLMDHDMLRTIHARIREQAQEAGGDIDMFYYCADHPDAPTNMRKPRDGMLLKALDDFGEHAHNTPFVGDSIRDMQAAHSAGCPRYMVKTGNGQAHYPRLSEDLHPVTLCNTLLDATQHIISAT